LPKGTFGISTQKVEWEPLTLEQEITKVVEEEAVVDAVMRKKLVKLGM